MKTLLFLVALSCTISTFLLCCEQEPEASRIQGDFEGEFDHDFGVVDYRDSTLDLHHTFVLRNVSSDTISIVEKAASCGCTAAELQKSVIPPGEILTVDVKLVFQSPLFKRETVRLLSEKGTITTLEISGTARRRHHIYSANRSIDIHQNRASQIVLFSTSHDSDSAPRLDQLRSPDGVTVSPGPWQLIHHRNPEFDAPARWQCELMLTRGENDIAKYPPLIIDCDGEQIFIDLNGWPGRVDEEYALAHMEGYSTWQP